MPRRKKKNRRVLQSPISRERQLKDRCSSLGWQVPFYLKNWTNHFISQTSYMHEFERWLAEKCRVGGDYVKVNIEIEDDFSYASDQWEKDWVDYWGEERETTNHKQYWGFNNNWARKLPMEHKIDAPSGDVGASLVCI